MVKQSLFVLNAEKFLKRKFKKQGFYAIASFIISAMYLLIYFNVSTSSISSNFSTICFLMSSSILEYPSLFYRVNN